MSKLVFSDKYKIRASDIDKNSKLKFNELVNYMQEAAWNSAKSLGFSTYEMLRKNISWVLNQQYFEVHRIPEHGETIEIQTWPSGMDKYFVYRDFKIYDSNKNLILESYSKWVVLDIIARKMISVPDSIRETKLNIPNSINFNFKKIRSDASLVTSEFPITVGWTDLDLNGHINNSQYFKWIVDALDEASLSQKSIKSLDIIFKSEGILRDVLASKVGFKNDNHSSHNIVNIENQKELVLAEIIFNNN